MLRRKLKQGRRMELVWHIWVGCREQFEERKATVDRWPGGVSP